MIDRDHELPLIRQADLLGLSRGSLYYQPRAVPAADLAVDRANQVWAMDITYIPMARGFVYLAAVVDWFQPAGALLAGFHHAGGRVLPRRARSSACQVRQAGNFNTDSKNDGVGRLRRSVAAKR